MFYMNWLKAKTIDALIKYLADCLADPGEHPFFWIIFGLPILIGLVIMSATNDPSPPSPGEKSLGEEISEWCKGFWDPRS